MRLIGQPWDLTVLTDLGRWMRDMQLASLGNLSRGFALSARPKAYVQQLAIEPVICKVEHLMVLILISRGLVCSCGAL